MHLFLHKVHVHYKMSLLFQVSAAATFILFVCSCPQIGYMGIIAMILPLKNNPYQITYVISLCKNLNLLSFFISFFFSLSTGLRTVVDDERKRGLTLGGRGEGQLTQEKIGKLQAYYTKAIRGAAGQNQISKLSQDNYQFL